MERREEESADKVLMFCRDVKKQETGKQGVGNQGAEKQGQELTEREDRCYENR